MARLIGSFVLVWLAAFATGVGVLVWSYQWTTVVHLEEPQLVGNLPALGQAIGLHALAAAVPAVIHLLFLRRAGRDADC